jgi:hypothetical protein
MTPQRQGAVIRKVRDITLGSTLSLALLTGTPLLQSCGSSERESDQTEQVQETTVTQGVRMYITETSPGQFKITDEVQVSPTESEAIVRYADGHTDSLSTQSAQALIDREVINNPSYNAGGFGLGNMLLYGGMGYMLGSMMNNNRYAQYRNQPGVDRSRFYASPGAYNSSQQVTRAIGNSRTVRTSRPSGGRSGYFSRSRSGGGYGG